MIGPGFVAGRERAGGDREVTVERRFLSSDEMGTKGRYWSAAYKTTINFKTTTNSTTITTINTTTTTKEEEEEEDMMEEEEEEEEEGTKDNDNDMNPYENYALMRFS